MTMQQLKNINKIDKHIHAHKKRYLEVNREKKNSNKNIEYMFKIVRRIGT
jgi:hypothetical protein